MLSDRAQRFLSTLERYKVPTDRAEVVEQFRLRKLSVPDAILAFQETYGGYTFYAGLEPLVATVLHPRANFLRDLPWTAPEVEGSADEPLYRCFDTLYQSEFFLSAEGVYYEDWQPVHENFDYLVEGKALLAELSRSGTWEPAEVALADFESLGLQRDEIASCRYTIWWRNEKTIVCVRGDGITAWERVTPA